MDHQRRQAKVLGYEMPEDLLERLRLWWHGHTPDAGVFDPKHRTRTTDIETDLIREDPGKKRKPGEQPRGVGRAPIGSNVRADILVGNTAPYGQRGFKVLAASELKEAQLEAFQDLWVEGFIYMNPGAHASLMSYIPLWFTTDFKMYIVPWWYKESGFSAVQYHFSSLAPPGDPHARCSICDRFIVGDAWYRQYGEYYCWKCLNRRSGHEDLPKFIHRDFAPKNVLAFWDAAGSVGAPDRPYTDEELAFLRTLDSSPERGLVLPNSGAPIKLSAEDMSDEAITKLVDTVLPQVAIVRGKRGAQAWTGTAWAFSPDRLVTCYHVAFGGMGTSSQEGLVLQASFDGHEYYPITIVEFDRDNDVTSLNFQSADALRQDLTGLPVGDASSIHPGDFIMAIGSPRGIHHVATFGHIATDIRELAGLPHEEEVMIDLYVTPGSSGSPVVNAAGDVLGMARGSLGEQPAVNYMIPINLIMKSLPDLRTRGKDYAIAQNR